MRVVGDIVWLQLDRFFQFVRPRFQRSDRVEDELLDRDRAVALDVEDESVRHVLDFDVLAGVPSAEVVVERLRGHEVAVLDVVLGVFGRPFLDDAADDLRLFLFELAGLAINLDALEVPVADGTPPWCLAWSLPRPSAASASSSSRWPSLSSMMGTFSSAGWTCPSLETRSPE